MPYVIAQLSDIHIGGRNAGNGERFSTAIREINQMSSRPDLVVLTCDLTENGTIDEWTELRERLSELLVPWEAIPGNHDRKISDLAGHRAMYAGPLRIILLDTSSDVFTVEYSSWLDNELAQHPSVPTVIAIHQPPFETGI
jgi:3',5'-cyclic-AMP phosphodiesterase